MKKKNRTKKWCQRLSVIAVLVLMLFSAKALNSDADAAQIQNQRANATFPPYVTTISELTPTVTTGAAVAPAPSAEEKSFWASVKDFFEDAGKFFDNVSTWLNPKAWINIFWQWLIDLIIKCAIAVNNLITNAVNTAFFSNQYVTASLDFFRTLGAIIFGCGIVFGIYGEVEKRMHDEPVNFNVLIMNYFKGLLMLLFIQPAIIYANNLMFEIISYIGTDGSLGSKLSMFTQYDATTVCFIIVVLLIATIIMFFSLLKRFAAMYIQILLGYVYIFDVVKGNTNSVGEYVKEVAAGIITFFVQMLMYRCGIVLMMSAVSGGMFSLVDSNLYVGLIMLVGVMIAPGVLKKYGFSVSTGLGQKLTSIAMIAGGAI